MSATGTIPKSTSSSTSKLKPIPKAKLAITKSLSQESLDDLKKQRDEKQKMAQMHRDQLDKEKREQALKLVKERDERHKKIMQEKEDKARMEALRKKLMKEKQERKFAEAKKDEFMKPKAVDQSVNLNDSLHLKLQKQLLIDKTEQQRRAEAKNTYSFDSLDTDDSTDDESRPSKKRPPPPTWCNSKLNIQLIKYAFALII